MFILPILRYRFAQRPLIRKAAGQLHVEVNVEVQRAAEALDQRHRASMCRLAGKSGLLDQVRGNASVNDAEYLAHDRRAARE